MNITLKLNEEEAVVLSKLMKKHLPKVDFVLPKPPGRPSVQGSAAREFLLDVCSGKGMLVSQIRKLADKEKIKWGTIIKEKRKIDFIFTQVGRAVNWRLDDGSLPG